MEQFIRKEFAVQYKLAYEFQRKAVEMGCKYFNMTEHIHMELLFCDLEVPKSKLELLDDMAFMTFISNPKFQKYYELDKMDK